MYITNRIYEYIKDLISKNYFCLIQFACLFANTICFKLNKPNISFTFHIEPIIVFSSFS